MADPESPYRDDPDLLSRWIAIASLLASAQDLQARGGGAWPALALVAADTANETILGTIAVAGDVPPERDATFDRVYHLAVDTLEARGHPMPESLRTRVVALHRQRNAAVHLGVEPGARAVDRAIATAAELRGLAVDALALLEAFRTAGPVRAVAELVNIEPISSALAAAERHLAADELKLAADQCAVALDATLQRVRPGLRSFMWMPPLDPQRERNLRATYDRLFDQARVHEGWILALGLGLRGRERTARRERPGGGWT